MRIVEGHELHGGELKFVLCLQRILKNRCSMENDYTAIFFLNEKACVNCKNISEIGP